MGIPKAYIPQLRRTTLIIHSKKWGANAAPNVKMEAKIIILLKDHAIYS